MKIISCFIGSSLQDFSRGIRLEELNVLLKQSVMVSACFLALVMLP